MLFRSSSGGLVASEGNVGDFYEKCLELLDNSIQYKELKTRGLAFAKTQSWCAVNGVVIDYYQKMVSQSKSRVEILDRLAVSAHNTD